jgi:cysteine desulfurase
MKNYNSAEPMYLDYNATTPVDEQVLEQMLPWYGRHFGNASSKLHAYGWRASEAVKLARAQTAAMINAEEGEIYFTSGATEALNLAIKGLYETAGNQRRQFIALGTEHKAVLDTLQYLEKKGAEVRILHADEQGMPDLDALINLAGEQTLGIIAMHANNETGLINPVSTIAATAHAAGAVFICDATQACGKIPVNVQEIGADLLALSAHKFYGPKGIGALFVRRKNPRIRLIPQIHGGGHENGLRSGTLNVPGIVGLGAAACLSDSFIAKYEAVDAQRRRLEIILQELGAIIHASKSTRLPNTINCRFAGIEAAKLIGALPDLALSTGSACSSATAEASHVLLSMGLSIESCRESIRISLGRDTGENETLYISEKFSNALRKLRA